AGERHYLLLVELPRGGGLATARSVAALFALTPAEVRVLGGLLDGATPAAIARGAGSALATVRTHISNILAKTDTAGQAELLVSLRGLR
ncbi:MAG TPA: LuxR C-terminal-related transcriptional regulator, partial [Ramlibacter sp.]|nr:LuxR C-terminal-related transcriptional regulator [Ramlibacter sp.]